MSDTNTQGQPQLETKPPTTSAGPIKPGDSVVVRRMVGGPVIRSVHGVVAKVHKANAGAPPELDITVELARGARDLLERVPAEPSAGATLNGPCSFPCWGRQ